MMEKKVLVSEHYLHPQCISPGMLSCFTFLNWNKQIAISSEIHSGLTKSYMSKAIGGVKFRREIVESRKEDDDGWVEVGRRRDRKRRMMLALNLWYLGTPRGGDRKEMPKGTQKGFRHFILLS